MYSKPYFIPIIFVCFSCNNGSLFSNNEKTSVAVSADKQIVINPYSSINEIPLPPGFTRTEPGQNLFGNWLLGVKLKKDKTVYKFDGLPKRNQRAQFAVLDISVGNKDLQQCADAVMRLRAEYLFAAKKYTAIHFTDNEGKVYQFGEPYDYKSFQQYLQRVFGACGSASLAKELHAASMKDIEPGDVLIHGGFPGHAEIVMDVATNKDGLKVYLLAQSYMPAQDIHVLVNPTNQFLSPWYLVNERQWIETPEYNFTKSELKRW